MKTWNSDSPAFETILNEVKPKTIFEIGTWHGGSAIRMATICPYAEIICIDTWLGSSEFYTVGGEDRDLEIKDGYPTVFHTFRKNTENYPNIKAIPLTSHEASFLVGSADLIYIDGSHDYDAVYQDLKDYHMKAPVLFGDDYNNKDFQVKEAVDDFCKAMGYKVEVINDWFWIIRK